VATHAPLPEKKAAARCQALLISESSLPPGWEAASLHQLQAPEQEAAAACYYYWLLHPTAENQARLKPLVAISKSRVLESAMSTVLSELPPLVQQL
jgi:hypothetical protein